ncbi:exonuclease/endonuclease/phosphatase family protein [Bacillus paranthracis]|uniref:hypothetical protein n=1 Tax=Bacillus paranthracis TaxID=2026186 RepID=UPI0021CFE8B9|nr:hypothetical protein [Bacillus paranthracis]
MQENRLPSYTPFQITIFNIGYAGLDAKQDFFMDGGTGSSSRSKEQTKQNLQHMSSFLKDDHAGFVLLQEVDMKAFRSFDQNEYQFFQQELSSHASTFGYNYRNPWVLVPFLRPIGYVESGLATFSTYFIQQATRFQLPGRDPWPKQLFDLDRAMVEHIIPVENGKNLRIVNLHVLAYDAGGNIRKQQLQYVKQYMNTQYQKGGCDSRWRLESATVRYSVTRPRISSRLAQMVSTFVPIFYRRRISMSCRFFCVYSTR